MTGHTIDREEVMAYVDGELEPARLSVVQAHVNTCAECGALCCGDCVEVVLRLSIPRAVCQSCLANSVPGGGLWQRVIRFFRR